MVNESIHIQLIHAVDQLVALTKIQEQRPGNRLTYEQSFMVAKAINLSEMAKTDCKNSGISIEAK